MEIDKNCILEIEKVNKSEFCKYKSELCKYKYNIRDRIILILNIYMLFFLKKIDVL